MNRKLSASQFWTIAVKSEGPFFSPGELVRLRMHWDDVDDDEETRTFRIANIMSSAPPYFARIEPLDEHPTKWNHAEIRPGQVGVYIGQLVSVGVGMFGPSTLVTVLFNDVKVRVAAHLLETYHGQV